MQGFFRILGMDTDDRYLRFEKSLAGIRYSKLLLFAFLNNYKKAKSFPLAPIEVEILISRGSASKIETENGTNAT